MFSPNPKNDDLNKLGIDELRRELKNAEEAVEAQKRSIETSGGRGIISGPMSNKLLTYYQQRKETIEDAIKNHTQSNSNKESKIEKKF